jgi:hypothetical protein
VRRRDRRHPSGTSWRLSRAPRVPDSRPPESSGLKNGHSLRPMDAASSSLKAAQELMQQSCQPIQRKSLNPLRHSGPVSRTRAGSRVTGHLHGARCRVKMLARPTQDRVTRHSA